MSQWISVNDQEPDHSDRIISYGKRGVVVIVWDEIWCEPFDWTEVKFSHWMPLPEPPSE